MLHTRISAIYLSLLLSAGGASAQVPKFIISTVAGAPELGTAPIPGPAAALGYLNGLAVDSTGNTYLTSFNPTVGKPQSFVLKLDPNGILTRFAGTDHEGYSGDGGPATQAQLNGASAVAVDNAGNLYIADGDRIRRVSPNGTILTVAGNGRGGDAGDGGPAVNANLNAPQALAVDASGNLYIAEGISRIRKVSPDGIITTVAGNGSYGYSGDGGPATVAQIGQVSRLAVDKSGKLYLADSFILEDDINCIYMASVRVRMIGADGVITTVAGSGPEGFSGDLGPATQAQLNSVGGLAVNADGVLYIADGDRVRAVTGGIIATVAGGGPGFSGDGGPALKAQFSGLSGLAFDSAGSLYVSDRVRIRKISTSGIVTTVAGNGYLCCALGVGGPLGGDGGPATQAPLDTPVGLAVDSAGAMYIADTLDYRVRKVSPDGVITTFAGGAQFSGDPGDGRPASSAQLFYPAGLVFDVSGNLYVADAGQGRIRKVSPSGVITTVAGTGLLGAIGFSGDGGPAIAARLSWPKDIVLDSAGNLYFVDTGNNRVRMISPSGIVTTSAGTGSFVYGGDGGPATSAGLSFPTGLAMDASANLYIADTNNYRVRKISSAGIITTVAGNGTQGFSGDGGPAVSAQLYNPLGLKFDHAGNLFIADGNSIRMLSPTGVITTVAGNGVLGYSGDGGPATKAQLGAWGLAFDSSGNLYVADPWNNNIRLLRVEGN